MRWLRGLWGLWEFLCTFCALVRLGLDTKEAPLGSVTGIALNPAGGEVPRVLFLGLCLNFHYFSTGVVFPKLGFDFSRRAVAQALVEP